MKLGAVDKDKLIARSVQGKQRLDAAAKDALEALFVAFTHPPVEERRRVAAEFALDLKRVNVWLQNRRQQSRRAKTVHAADAVATVAVTSGAAASSVIASGTVSHNRVALSTVSHNTAVSSAATSNATALHHAALHRAATHHAAVPLATPTIEPVRGRPPSSPPPLVLPKKQSVHSRTPSLTVFMCDDSTHDPWPHPVSPHHVSPQHVSPQHVSPQHASLFSSATSSGSSSISSPSFATRRVSLPRPTLTLAMAAAPTLTTSTPVVPRTPYPVDLDTVKLHSPFAAEQRKHSITLPAFASLLDAVARGKPAL